MRAAHMRLGHPYPPESQSDYFLPIKAFIHLHPEYFWWGYPKLRPELCTSLL